MSESWISPFSEVERNLLVHRRTETKAEILQEKLNNLEADILHMAAQHQLQVDALREELFKQMQTLLKEKQEDKEALERFKREQRPSFDVEIERIVQHLQSKKNEVDNLINAKGNVLEYISKVATEYLRASFNKRNEDVCTHEDPKTSPEIQITGEQSVIDGDEVEEGNETGNEYTSEFPKLRVDDISQGNELHIVMFNSQESLLMSAARAVDDNAFLATECLADTVTERILKPVAELTQGKINKKLIYILHLNMVL